MVSGVLRKRKSPYKHPVKEHRRKGNPVRNYERGKGNQVVKARRSRVVGGSSNPSEFDVSLYYYDNKRENVEVSAKNYSKALGSGLERRDAVSPVHIIRVRRERD